jgi:hypothetical protein
MESGQTERSDIRGGRKPSPTWLSIFITLLLLFGFQLNGQSWQLEAASGFLNYQGELRANRFTFAGAKPSGYVGVRRSLGDLWYLTAGIAAGSLTGRDADNPAYYTRRRNLHFETGLFECSLMGAYRMLNAASGLLKTHVSMGAAMFWVDPFTRDVHGKKYKLYGLSLEGQGLSEYPGLALPRRLNLSLPCALNLSVRMTESVDLELEFNMRKTFTDQIDAVSGAYPLESSLRAARGDLAVELSYRGDELSGEDLRFPPEGTMRGNPRTKDWYYGAMLKFVWSLGERSNSRSYPRSPRLFKPRGWPYRI